MLLRPHKPAFAQLLQTSSDDPGAEDLVKLPVLVALLQPSRLCNQLVPLLLSYCIGMPPACKTNIIQKISNMLVAAACLTVEMLLSILPKQHNAMPVRMCIADSTGMNVLSRSVLLSLGLDASSRIHPASDRCPSCVFIITMLDPFELAADLACLTCANGASGVSDAVWPTRSASPSIAAASC